MKSGGNFKSRTMSSANRDSLPSFLSSIEDFKKCLNKGIERVDTFIS